MMNLTTPRSCRSARARSVSPRPSSARRLHGTPPFSTPRSSSDVKSVRPKSAIAVVRSSEFPSKPLTTPRKKEKCPSQFSKKALTPPRMSENGPLKPAKPKAGSDKPVAIRPRSRKPPQEKPPENVPLEEVMEEERKTREGYYIYVYNEQQRKSMGSTEGKPTASVKPMFASEFLDNNYLDQLDLKPLTFNVTPADSLEAVNAC